ncbi:MAG: acetylhydrolase [Candidatus Accumulibacter phosphatis]|jgi:dienelactone hydrolase|uniref:Acetylhydrolase n=1 Tax=Candidatus Accumulibacter contiguus TaxID=2954381 RepID=A0ABX1T9T9_9PROT|nr:acetylhydrolase [Candidatus Accumulibacter contiguus]NMQ05766.1 acetylhydrolase [Candidatus Accumulibacter contiguus]
MKHIHWTAVLVLAACANLLVACAGAPDGREGGFVESWSVRNQAALVEADLVPKPADYEIRYFQWFDRDRQREVLAKLYLPPAAVRYGPLPMVAFSHGMGGSREGYSYLGANWAARGYASLHVQHAGSDSRLWSGNPLDMVSRLQSAASEAEAVNRVRDLRFALDEVLADLQLAGAIDAGRILAAGHSYGANTALLAAGAVFARPQGMQSYRDSRIVGAVIISAPPFHGEPDPESVVQPVGIPTLHITAKGDEIRIPGYRSGYEDRLRVFAATGSARKALVAFRDGSHSMFTDRLGTGGRDLNPLVKAATVDLTLAFFEEVLGGTSGVLAKRSARYDDLLVRFESEPRAAP